MLTCHQPFRFLGVRMLIEIDNRHVCSFLGKGYSDRAADSAVSAGNQGDFAIEFSRTLSSAILRARPGLHLTFEAWLAVLLLLGTRRLFFFF